MDVDSVGSAPRPAPGVWPRQLSPPAAVTDLV